MMDTKLSTKGETPMPLYHTSAFIGCEAEYDEARVVLFGAPFDGTCSYRPGSRFAPAKIRPDSYGLETYSLFMDKDLADSGIHDAGDLELPFGDTAWALQMIEDYAEKVFTDGKKPLMIGGEHLVSLPVIKAAARRYPDLHILHFDAHTDLRTDYMGVSLSHASVIRKAWDILGDGRIFQFGIRSGLKEEFHWAMQEGHTLLCPFDCSRLQEAAALIGGAPVYLTIDVDVLDPSLLPGTGTPEPGGLTFREMLAALKTVSGLNLVGADVVELAPDYDPTGVSTAVTSKLLREVMLTL